MTTTRRMTDRQSMNSTRLQTMTIPRLMTTIVKSSFDQLATPSSQLPTTTTRHQILRQAMVGNYIFWEQVVRKIILAVASSPFLELLLLASATVQAVAKMTTWKQTTTCKWNVKKIENAVILNDVDDTVPESTENVGFSRYVSTVFSLVHLCSKVTWATLRLLFTVAVCRIDPLRWWWVPVKSAGRSITCQSFSV